MKKLPYWLKGGIILLMLGILSVGAYMAWGEVCQEIAWAVDLNNTQEPGISYYICKLFEYGTFIFIIPFYFIGIFSLGLFFIGGSILGGIYGLIKKV